MCWLCGHPIDRALPARVEVLVTLTVVVGPPAGGKTTWVMDRAGPEDIVIDFDRLAVALAGPGADSHQHPKALRDVAFRARAGAITAALQLARTTTVYLIHTQPNERAMEQYVKAGAEVVTIDPAPVVMEEQPAVVASRQW